MSDPRDDYHAVMARAQTSAGGQRLRAGLSLAVLVWLPGCLVLGGSTAGPPVPDEQALASIVPGRTTRAELVQRLGPPDEYRDASFAAAVMHDDSQAQRVLEEHAVFDRRAATWTREHRSDRIWLLWPLYSNRQTDIRTDRLVVLFDTAGVVSAIGCDRGIDAR